VEIRVKITTGHLNCALKHPCHCLWWFDRPGYL